MSVAVASVWGYGRSFRHSRDAKAFLVLTQHEFELGGRRDAAIEVPLGCLIAEFDEARSAGLSYASQQGYRNTADQLLEYFGAGRKLRSIQQRHAEAFLATRKRRDGRAGDLSSWSKARHMIHCRAIYNRVTDANERAAAAAMDHLLTPLKAKDAV